MRVLLSVSTRDIEFESGLATINVVPSGEMAMEVLECCAGTKEDCALEPCPARIDPRHTRSKKAPTKANGLIPLPESI
jgi:hypothetical protein